jgi:hypothetical protein
LEVDAAGVSLRLSPNWTRSIARLLVMPLRIKGGESHHPDGQWGGEWSQVRGMELSIRAVVIVDAYGEWCAFGPN